MDTQAKRLNTWIEQWISAQNKPTNVKVEALAGDGSTRCFYRLKFTDESHVLLSDREWIFSKDYHAHQAYLAACGIAVPKFITVDPTAGFLVMEDLGDELLQHRILSDPQERMAWLREATLLLAHFHGKTFPVPTDLPVATRSFDKKKYWEEMLFTEEHLLVGYLKLPRWSDEERAAVQAFCESLGAYQPQVFAHRDYHTRNLLVRDQTLYMIDFQDARLGPPHYDLASLLYDAYVPVSEAEKVALTALYLKQISKYPKLHTALSLSSFSHDLSWVALQRVIKAAGSFASFFTRYGKKNHLPYLRPALQSALQLQSKDPFPAELNRAFDLQRWLDHSERVKI